MGKSKTIKGKKNVHRPAKAERVRKVRMQRRSVSKQRKTGRKRRIT